MLTVGMWGWEVWKVRPAAATHRWRGLLPGAGARGLSPEAIQSQMTQAGASENLGMGLWGFLGASGLSTYLTEVLEFYSPLFPGQRPALHPSSCPFQDLSFCSFSSQLVCSLGDKPWLVTPQECGWWRDTQVGWVCSTLRVPAKVRMWHWPHGWSPWGSGMKGFTWGHAAAQN